MSSAVSSPRTRTQTHSRLGLSVPPDTGPDERPVVNGTYNRTMRRALDIGLIVGFLAVDFLFFHDLLKPGEVTTLPQYLTGLLSISVLAICGQSLLKSVRR